MKDIFRCYLCSSGSCAVIADSKTIRFECYGFDKYIVKCSSCGLAQLYPPWNEEELSKLYRQYSRKKDFVGYKPKKTVSHYIENYIKKTDRILEIGCGFGNNLRGLRKKGYDVIGIDKDPTVCDGKIVKNYDFDVFPSPAEGFDFIYAIQVFEHMSDPRRFIKTLVRNLKTNGRFLLEIPNIDDPLLKSYRVNNFNKFYWYPYHLFFYNKETVSELFKGFSEITVKVSLFQRYGLINHLRWLIFGRPGNFNRNIPMIDDIYKLALTGIFKSSDTLIITGIKK